MLDTQTGDFFLTRSRHLNYSSAQYTAYTARVESLRQQQSNFQHLPIWASYGNRLADIEIQSYSKSFLVIDLPTEGRHLKFDLADWFQFYGPEYLWGLDSTVTPTRELTWSPDGNYVLFQYLGRQFIYAPNTYREVLSWHFLLADIANASLKEIAAFPQSPHPLSGSLQPRPLWSADSHTIVFAHQPYAQQFIAHHAAGSSRVLPLLQNGDGTTALVYEIPSTASSLEDKLSSVALSGWNKGQTTITLTDTHLQTQAVLIEGANDAGDPSWSPDGGQVAVVWATGSQTSRVVRLTWANADGTGKHTLDDELWNVQDLRWLNDGQSLAYVSARLQGQALEIVNLKTGAHRQIGTAVAQIARLTQNPQTGVLTYWWRTEQQTTGINTIGISSYMPDGTLIHQAQLSEPIDGLEIFRNPYVWSKNVEIFPSPDAKVYLVRYSPDRWPNYPSSVQLIAADGSWSQVIYKGGPVTPNYPPLITPALWSPDSQRIFFYTQVYPAPTVFMISVNGPRVLRTVAPWSADLNNLFWSDCRVEILNIAN